jgi:hypothetical protein
MTSSVIESEAFWLVKGKAIPVIVMEENEAVGSQKSSGSTVGIATGYYLHD